MSKKKMSVEELLEEALVPEEDWPYKVPKNWVWVKLNSYYDQINEQIMPLEEEKYLGLEHFKKNGGIKDIGVSKGLKSKKVSFKSGDVLYGKLRPYLNKHAIANFDGLASTDILVYRSKFLESNKLLNKYIGLPLVVKYSNENSSGINLPRISPKKMNKLPVPLPPLKEQKRINDKVEKLFDKISRAKQLIEEAKGTFELRRAAILDKAFRGELTIKWRKENERVEPAYEGIKRVLHEIPESNKKKLKNITLEEIPYNIPETWTWVRATQVCDVRDGTHDSPKYVEEGYPLITSKNLKRGRLDFSKINYISEEDHINISKRSKVEHGDILFAMIGTIGNPVLIDQITSEFSIKNMGLFKPYDSIDNEYLVYYLESMNYLQPLISKAKGSTQKFVSLGKLRESLIPVPPLEEQIEIREKLKTILDNLYTPLEQLESIKLFTIQETILSKAFKGELGTNDTKEESAVQLLKEVLQEN